MQENRRSRHAECNVLRLFFVSGHGDLESCEVNEVEGRENGGVVSLLYFVHDLFNQVALLVVKVEEETEK